MRQDEPLFDGPVFDNKTLTNLMREFGKSRTLLWQLFTSSEVPTWVKFIPILSILYSLSPFDVLLIPFLGPLDDIAVLIFGTKLFVELCPRELVDRLRDEINYGTPTDDDGEVIDATYHILDDDQ